MAKSISDFAGYLMRRSWRRRLGWRGTDMTGPVTAVKIL
jgi:hypothetical protein